MVASAGRGAAGGMPSDLPLAVAQILGPDGSVAGAGFLVAEDVLITCAHVVRAAGSGPGEGVLLAFPHVAGADHLEGQVLPGPWRAPEDEDVAFVRLRGTPSGARVLPLGSAEGCRGHRVRSFGFPAQAPRSGHSGYGEAGDLLPASAGRSSHLQLTDANDLTTGFSGGPVLDEMTGLVIGMLTEITAPDALARGQGVAYVTPTEVLREIRPELAAQEVCPYRGLEPFTAEHARWFQGRADAVQQVLTNLTLQRRLTLLLGPSGSGKSSLIQAGVLQALAAGKVPGSDRWLPVLARPRQDLQAEIERAGLPGAARDGITAAVARKLASEPGHERVLLVIDQFEELLVQGAGGGLQDFLAVIDDITAAADATTRLSVILVMRDDFYPQLAALAPRLLEAATPGLLNVPGVMSQRDLHDIIVLPADDVGLRFQPGLPEQIISDVLASSPEAADRMAPVTVLPLLELTLRQLWLRREDGFLTHEEYRRIGAVTGSLTAWCDSALEELSPGQQDIAKRILTSLVRPEDPGRRIPAVRAQVPLDDLRDLAASPDKSPNDDVDAVIATLARHRIIITAQTLRDPKRPDAPPGKPVAELIHDALIRDWGVLREWVRKDHQFQEWLNRTRERQLRWAEKGDPGDLLAGTALAEGVERSQERGLPDDIAAFLTASRQRQEAVAQRRRRLIAVLATLLVLALLGGAVAIWQWQRAVGERQAALSRQLATESDTLLGTNPELASLLAVQSYRTSHTPESLASLRTAAALPLHRRLVVPGGAVWSVAFSPDGRTLATANDDHTIRLWDRATGKTRTTLVGHTDKVFSAVFSPDGRMLATGSADGTARLWNVATAKSHTTLTGHTEFVSSVAFSPDGRTLATGSADGTARLWNVATAKSHTTLTGHTGSVWSVAFSPDGRTAATGSADFTARLWDADTGKTRNTLTGHTDAVQSVAFSPDGHTIATGSADFTARLWDADTGKTRRTLTGHTGAVQPVAFSPDGRTLATGSSDHTARLWDVAAGTTITTLTGHTNVVYAVAFSPDGRTLATSGRDRTARLWDVAGRTRNTLIGHTDSVTSVAFGPDGRTAASGSFDGTVRLWDVATGKTRKPLTGHSSRVLSVAFSPDGRNLATGSADATARLWVVASDVYVILNGHTTDVADVAFSPDGRTLATGSSDGTVRLWDVATGEPRAKVTYPDGVGAVQFSPDGRTLVSGSVDGPARLWDVATAKTRKTLTGHTDALFSVAFSPDGRTIATASVDRTVRLWDVATAKTRTTLTGHTDTVQSVAFSPDGHTVATGSVDNTVRLWDVATGKTRTTLTTDHVVNAVAFSPDGHTLATAGGDNTVRLWNVVPPQPSEAIQKICRAVNRDLTPEERTAYLPGRSVGHVCPTQ
ncbi:WD40 repeat protein [Streptomyces sp. IGB124]|nr:WD40 repeat protein [Streptomyces sp. IGB124]